jgi:molybdopterin-containing oxidoreductase family iron-sulfur binding subunit
MPELDRRDFLKLVGVGAGTAATACSDPVEKLVPYVVQPENVTPGLSTWYASTCMECSAACGLHVQSREGRPIKLEGNPEHPINRGKLCARGQASLGRTYHPDRYAGPLMRSAAGALESASWDDARAELVGRLKAAGGQAWIMGAPVGPSLDGVLTQFASAAGLAGRIVYEPFAHEALREGTRAVFGVASLPIFDVGEADLLIDLGSDFLDTGRSPVENSQQFADARDVKQNEYGGTRLISVGPRLDLTTTSADRWIPAKAGSEGLVALALAKAVFDVRGVPAGIDAADVQGFLAASDAATAASRAGIERSDLDALVDALVHAKHPLVMPPGVASTTTSATSTAATVMLLNALIGAVGRSVVIPPEGDAPAAANFAEIKGLVDAMQAGKVKLLVIHDTNPVYSLPAELGFADALAKVDFVVSFASLKDETSEAAHLVLPDHSAMESWGDAAPRPGVRSLVQPTVRPLLDSQALGDTLLAVIRDLGTETPQSSFRDVVQNNWSDVAWRDALGRGGVFSDFAFETPSLVLDPAKLSFSTPKLAGDGEYTLIAFPHSFLADGSAATLPWLQEIPHPVTKLAWNSWVEVSFATAEKLGVGFGDVVKVTTPSGSLETSIFPRGAIRDDVIAIPIGQGHSVGFYASEGGPGESGGPRGANVISVLPATTDERGGRVWLGTKADVAKTGGFRRLALSQWTDNQRGRGLAQTVSVADLVGETHDDHGDSHRMLDFDASFDADPDQPYRWGMTIDNDRCNGCSACVAACYIENNIPVVGEEQAIMRREMSWIRIERYVGEGDLTGGADRRPIPKGEKLGETDIRHIPMPCQHCGAAPCEAVCPTLATYHNVEGMNGMIYNRCAGTRYCANNCVYKVRRFNYWDYGHDNFPGLLGLMLSPDVTVRGQGVMEKCSYCVQRIEEARQPAKDEGREIRDGEVVTACQQSCPTNAITFGNLRDKESQVVKRGKEEKRAYHLLQELNTRPALTYLAQVSRDEQEGSH